jgi:hypothetical protein
MSAKRLVAGTLLVALVATACSGAAGSPGGGSGATGDAPEDQTAWERVVTAMDEGPVSLESALGAFVLAIGPLPGVDAPPGERTPIRSGTGALRWVLANWDDLSGAQRDAVDAYLDGGDDASAGAGPVVAAAAPLYLAADEVDEVALLGLIEQMETKIAANLNRDLGVPIELVLAPQLTQGDAWMIADGRDAAGGHFGKLAKCRIIVLKPGIPIASQVDEQGLASDELTVTIAHEVFHCFEEAVGTLNQSYQRPRWIVEGLAEWAGATLAGGPPNTWWTLWLNEPARSLFTRAYDAIGFYAHLEEHGADVWSSIDEMIEASDGGDHPAYEKALAAAGDDALTAWGPGYFRDPAAAPLWDQDGPGITIDRPPPVPFPSITPGTGTAFTAPVRAGAVYTTELDAQVVTAVGAVNGVVRLPDGAELTFPDASGTVLCTDPGGCTCEEGTPGAAAIFRQTTTGEVRGGVAGHVEGGDLILRGWDLGDFCEEYEPPSVLNPCFVGTWMTISYTATEQDTSGGLGIFLAVDGSGQAELDFEGSIPIYSRVPGAVVQVVQEGQIRPNLMPVGEEAVVAGGVAYGYSAVAYVDYGAGWMKAGQGVQSSGPSVGVGSTLACDGDLLTWTAPGSVSQYTFERLSSVAEPLEPPEGDGEDLGGGGAGGGGGGGEGGGPTPSVPPDFGLGLDACELLTIDEVHLLAPGAVQPAAEDDVSSQFLHQCTYEGAFVIQVVPAQDPDVYKEQLEGFDLDAVEIDGIGDWALAFINQPDPVFDTTDSVFWVSASNGAATVSFTPWNEIHQEDSEFAILLDLLETALSRL